MARARARSGWSIGEHGELVATEAGHEVVPPDETADPLGHGDEKGIAGCVTEGVVDDLEVVEVDEEHGADGVRKVRCRLRIEYPLEAQLEHAAVRRAGERVAFGEVLDVA